MKTDEILQQTFASHEHMTPDADLALDGIRHRVRTRRRSRAAVASVVVAVIAVAVGATFLPGNHHSATPEQTPRSVAPAKKPSPAKPHPVPAPDHVTIAAGWLPAGKATQVLIDNGFGRQLRGYNVISGGQTTYLLIGSQPGPALPTDYKRGIPNDLTIGGRPAREWSVDDWYYLAFVTPTGEVATVDIESGQGRGGDGSAAALAAMGHQVAMHLKLNRQDPIEPGFALSYLPAGIVVSDVWRDQQSGTRYTLTPTGARWADTMPEYANVSVVAQSWHDQAAQGAGSHKSSPPSTPGRPVQGHRSYVFTGDDVPMLWIDSVRPDLSIEITGGPGVTTLAEVYRIADGLILPH